MQAYFWRANASYLLDFPTSRASKAELGARKKIHDVSENRARSTGRRAKARLVCALLRLGITELAPSIAKLVNLSLSSGTR